MRESDESREGRRSKAKTLSCARGRARRADERDQEKEESKRDEKEFLSLPCLLVSASGRKRERERGGKEGGREIKRMRKRGGDGPTRTEVVCKWPRTREAGWARRRAGGRVSGTLVGGEGARGQK